MLCKDMNSKAIYHDYHTTSLLLLLLFSVGQHAASQNHGTRGLAPRGSSPRSTARTCSANGGHLPSHGNTPKSSLSHCRQTSDISPTKSKDLNVSRLVLQMSLPNPLKPVNEDVVGATPTGDAPTTSKWSTILLPTKVRLRLYYMAWHWGINRVHPQSMATQTLCVSRGLLTRLTLIPE